ncbi:MAG: bifunctional phosphopantothenoylcysteine decarboxylase/phosphopantothenate--cysteine ligase CoaBC, partial [Dehalococcoidia bacterium]
MYNLTDRHVVLAVCGSIAAYKAADLASKLTQAGALVDVVMTESATRFLSPLTFQGVTGRQVHLDMFAGGPGSAEAHVELGRQAEAVVVAPASATTIARIALGLAEDMVSLTAMATKAPIIICPAMDTNMYENAATQANLARLKQRGALLVGPEEGRLASGRVGPGRLVDTETILGAVRYALGRTGDLVGKKVVVSAGGTQEPIDPARFVGNYSSGKMGYAVAEAARDRGAQVVLVAAATALPQPYGVETIAVRRAVDMGEAIVAKCADADVVVMAAAVADYQPAKVERRKIKRRQEGLVVELVPTPDILAEVGKGDRLVKVGFAAESEDLSANARRKLQA